MGLRIDDVFGCRFVIGEVCRKFLQKLLEHNLGIDKALGRCRDHNAVQNKVRLGRLLYEDRLALSILRAVACNDLLLKCFQVTINFLVELGCRCVMSFGQKLKVLSIFV